MIPDEECYPVNSFYKDQGDVELTFLGPSFVYASDRDENWSARVEFGLGMASTTSTFKKEPGQKLKDNERNGFARLAFNLGLRFYL